MTVTWPDLDILPSDKQAVFLAQLAHKLTIFARESYSLDHVTLAQRTRAFNEMLHQLTSQIAHVVAGTRGRYPHTVMFATLVGIAEQARCLGMLQAAVDETKTMQNRD